MMKTDAITALEGSRRTSNEALLAVATAIRSGRSISARKPFSLVAGPGAAPYRFAAWHLANAIRIGKSKDIAVIAPSRTWATEVVATVAQGPVGKTPIGPYSIRWELGELEVVQSILQNLVLPEAGEPEAVLSALQGMKSMPAVRQCMDWIDRCCRLGIGTAFPPELMKERLAIAVSSLRRHSRLDGVGLKAMTVHQAKNREFDGVVVLWPYKIGGDAEQQRRLLYNAVTRAKQWCVVVVQGKDILGLPPFTAN
jgi:hypothetical protein